MSKANGFKLIKSFLIFILAITYIGGCTGIGIHPPKNQGYINPDSYDFGDSLNKYGRRNRYFDQDVHDSQEF